MPPLFRQSGPFWFEPFVVQSHVPAYCGALQSFGWGSAKMHAYWRSPFFVSHSRPLNGSAVSLAVAHAAANAQQMPLWQSIAFEGPIALPLPEIQIFGGGAHAGRRLDIQDLMVMPIGADSFTEALAMSAAVYRAAGMLMQEAGRFAGVADEGGYWPLFDSNEDALTMLVRAIERAGLHPGVDVALSLDIAASELYRDGRYRLPLDRALLDAERMAHLLLGWLDEIARALSFDIPVLVAVPEFRFSEWLSFCRGMGVKLPCRDGSLQSWWNAMIVGEPRSERERRMSVCEISK